ncbi:MAG: hypothetical protein HRU50_12765 [Winogradskyella sp.]|uniref:hypothetical protein n=1 Tax=Winogradskyella sp. TaxID=1883156 RepID=UPI0025F17B73|nr:hypothetical protein [Winogradskyella sp.]NRB60795.1 hypothetical protein [Winogradskyella sp.]
MNKKLPFLMSLILSSVLFIEAQETINLSDYDGSAINVTATSTVNDEITIVFEDTDIVNNFYTEFQDQIYMYGGLDTSNGGFQGAPDFNDLTSQPVLNLTDGDNGTQPNTYSITINLANHYTGVPDGTTIFGFNLLFQNQFGGGGNNQTVDLYIDLTDATKSSTLGNSLFSNTNNVNMKFIDNKLFLENFESGKISIQIYDTIGKKIYDNKALKIQNSYSTEINLNYKGIILIAVEVNGKRKTLKAYN